MRDLEERFVRKGLDTIGKNLQRGVDKGKMCDAWNEALANNTPGASDELKQQFTQLCSWMEDIEKGEQFVFTYVPGTGTTVKVKGADKGTIAG